MQTLIIVLSFLMQHGVTLDMVEFETVWPDQQMHKEWDCHGFVDTEGTILACVTDRKIIVLPNKKP
jgi:hypothetical protein